MQQEAHLGGSIPAVNRRRAIVIGGGIAGVTVARALADRFEHVLVLERDPHVVPRPHAPQSPHSHVFGSHGYGLLCQMFPGFDADLAAAGAPRFDWGECPFHAGQWTPRRTFGLGSRSATRSLIESALRRQLAKHANVELATGERARELLRTGDRVTAIRREDGSEIEAELVVDAAGVGSKTPEWLAQHGYQAPTRTEVDLRGGVVSQLFEPPPDADQSWILLNVRRSGGCLRHGVLSQVEEGLWRVSLAAAGMRPPKALPELLAFARSLATPRIGELLAAAKPHSPPSSYNNNWSQWIHYEELPRFPDGLIVIGDAMFHPNYEHGQGMTFCAMTAELVGEHLDQHELGLREGSSLGFQRALGALAAPLWDWNLSVELNVPVTEAPPQSPATQLRHRYFRLLRRVGLGDADLWKTMLEVTQSLRCSRSLLHPAMLARALELVDERLPADEVRAYERLVTEAAGA